MELLFIFVSTTAYFSLDIFFSTLASPKEVVIEADSAADSAAFCFDFLRRILVFFSLGLAAANLDTAHKEHEIMVHRHVCTF